MKTKIILTAMVAVIMAQAFLPLASTAGTHTALSSGVMFQGFYWDVPEGWYATLADAAPSLGDINGYSIDYIWFPPPSKGMSGASSMGYDIYDYYDLGSYDQKDTIETRFGSFDGLKDAIETYHGYGIGVIGDLVLNHRGGGDLEFNPNVDDSTYTDFGGVASQQCTWHYDEFHPSSYGYGDEGSFGGFPDLCHTNEMVIGDLTAWGQWLREIGFDGWRFDYVKGYPPWVSGDFKYGTGDPFSVAEFWDRDVYAIEQWISDAGGGIWAFDFPLYYTMRDVCMATDGSGDMRGFIDPYASLVASNPSRAVTFAANHDTDEIVYDKMLAYGFMLTYEGIPCIWWKDYFDYGLSDGGADGTQEWGNGIDQLIWVRGALGGGSPEVEVVYVDSDLLIYQEIAHQGYVVVLNDSKKWRGMNVGTRFSEVEMKCYAWSSTIDNSQPQNKWSDPWGSVELWAPPRGYAIYAPANI